MLHEHHVNPNTRLSLCLFDMHVNIRHWLLQKTFHILAFTIFCLMFVFLASFPPGSGEKNAYSCYCQNYRTGYHRGCVVESAGLRRRPPSSNHSLCTAWQCQQGVLEYNLFLQTKPSTCIIQAVQRGTLKMATRGLENKTWSSHLIIKLNL